MPDILVVDDEPGIGRMIRLLLTSEGMSAHVVHSGADGLDYVKRAPVEVIVLDLQMPGMDGRSFYRGLRAMGDTTPVIILSANGARKAQLELGAEDSLAKPFMPDDLLAKVRALVSRHSPSG